MGASDAPGEAGNLEDPPHGDDRQVTGRQEIRALRDAKIAKAIATDAMALGKAMLTETIMPGVVTFMLGHGHWATGAVDVTMDGRVVKGDPRRGTGIHTNAAMWIDPHLKNTCMLDPVGGSVSFYDTKVNLIKVS